MRKAYLPFLMIIVVLILSLLFPFNHDTSSVVPGWHTTIWPPEFIFSLISIIILVFVSIGYWLLSKKVEKANWILFSIHFVCTISTIIFIKFPLLLVAMFTRITDQEPLRMWKLFIYLMPVAYLFFIAGQVIFAVYFFRTLKRNKIEP